MISRHFKFINRIKCTISYYDINKKAIINEIKR